MANIQTGKKTGICEKWTVDVKTGAPYRRRYLSHCTAASMIKMEGKDKAGEKKGKNSKLSLSVGAREKVVNQEKNENGRSYQVCLVEFR